MSTIDTAIALAAKVHAGQVDKAGQPYILHPLRLMLRMTATEEKIVAVLHDVVEDGGITFDDLRAMGFAEAVIAGVDGMTRRTEENYQDFIVRAAGHPLARAVKIQDIRDNMDLTRLNSVSDKDLERVAKYHRSLRYLEAAS
ncbi:Guanosine-3',5'-bis(Diphosphate) 3'-pyrophosphohydrolase [Asticcacaulis sp. AC460]|uniref:HD domain-containing protein n=1 Tax=Asticcacaulis sp. AC460 TaxID=1282360 RepID=UPI0003C3D65A|nr:HD domain-containing protein [Asticcacaulis sp. AC460]ESQ91459.1 Guanosine-3',5'-bis(Diphosphate) 3'-pyrophosphohydrolase [Asticcacaulis sp. AC460]